MRTNTDITLYTRTIVSGAERYTRSVIRGVMWEDRRAANSRNGVKADDVAVYIPLSRGASLQAGDVIVKGAVADQIAGTFTVTKLRAKYPTRTAVVISVDTFDQGSPGLHHLQVGAA